MIQQLYDCFKHWSATGSVYLFSDPHFDDKELYNAYLKRPSSSQIIKNLSQKCHKSDCLILLGDIGNPEYLNQLKCYKVLIMGNHDVGVSNYKRKIEKKKFDKNKYSKEDALKKMQSLYPNCKYTINEGYDFHMPFEFWSITADNCLFDEVYTGPLMISSKILLSHEPIEVSWAKNICGHVHDKKAKLSDNIYCINPDRTNNYFPLSLGEMIKSGLLADIEDIHQEAIDKATKRSKKKNPLL